jgi:hypothetical protein
LHDLQAHFDAKWQPEPNSGCWLWHGHADINGYGKIYVEGKSHLAHRISYALHCHEIPDGAHVCHKCDTPSCVNPNHLFLGDHQSNMADKVRKGRASSLKGEDNGRALLTEAQAIEIIALLATGKISVMALSRRFQISYHLIYKIKEGRSWRHLPRPS